MERRTFTELAKAQNNTQAGASLAGQSSSDTSQVEISGNKVFLRRYGKGGRPF
jgi:hypothetical protein